MVSSRARKMERSLRVVEVLDLELEPVLVLDRTTNTADAIREMRSRGLGYALITDNDELIGIFTEKDVLLSVLGNESTIELPVTECMTLQPTCVRGTDTVGHVIVLMHEHGYRQIPVIEDGSKVSGCVRHKDIAEYLVNHFADHILNLPPDPEQVAMTPEGG